MSRGQSIALGAWLLIGLGLLGWLGLAVQAQGTGTRAVTWTRTDEPVVVSGAQLAELEGAAIPELWLYAFNGSAWAPIPFQIDEVDASGVYTLEDGLLDANDELVFMAMDLGAQAAAGQWLTDSGSLDYPRYELRVTNPLDPAEQGWAYLYRSPTLSPTLPADYVDWDPATNRLSAGTYVIGLAPTSHAGIDTLELNGSGVDALDRSKVRLELICYIGPIPIGQTLTEEDLVAAVAATPDVDGPVRVGGGSVEGANWAYYSLNVSRLAIDLSTLEPPPFCTSIVVESARVSIDWLDPQVSGMAPAVYYDANTPAGVPIDGSPDAVPGTPFAAWRQVSGGQGSTVSLADMAAGGATLSNYYLDDQALDANDTGDQRSFGDAGARLDDPAGLISIELQTYVLGPDRPNVGALYQSYRDNPLQPEAAAQWYVAPCEPPAGASLGWAPGPVYAGASTLFSAAVATGTLPLTYTWTFGDDGSVVAGSPVSHIFAVTGTFPVTLAVDNACGTASPVVEWVAVAERPEGDYRVYLPLVTRH